MYCALAELFDAQRGEKALTPDVNSDGVCVCVEVLRPSQPIGVMFT